LAEGLQLKPHGPHSRTTLEHNPTEVAEGAHTTLDAPRAALSGLLWRQMYPALLLLESGYGPRHRCQCWWWHWGQQVLDWDALAYDREISGFDREVGTIRLVEEVAVDSARFGMRGYARKTTGQ
jgi:hypothetical protein